MFAATKWDFRFYATANGKREFQFIYDIKEENQYLIHKDFVIAMATKKNRHIMRPIKELEIESSKKLVDFYLNTIKKKK